MYECKITCQDSFKSVDIYYGWKTKCKVDTELGCIVQVNVWFLFFCLLSCKALVQLTADLTNVCLCMTILFATCWNREMVNKTFFFVPILWCHAIINSSIGTSNNELYNMICEVVVVNLMLGIVGRKFRLANVRIDSLANRNSWVIIDFSLQNALVLYCLVNPTNNVLEHVSFYVIKEHNVCCSIRFANSICVFWRGIMCTIQAIQLWSTQVPRLRKIGRNHIVFFVCVGNWTLVSHGFHPLHWPLGHIPGCWCKLIK